MCSSIEENFFDNNVPFDNTTPIYLINLLLKLGLRLGLDLQFHDFRILNQGSQQEKINFSTKFFSKFQDNFRTFCRFHKVQNTENPYILLA